MSDSRLDSIPPPERITFYFCPTCGRSVRGTYNVDPTRKACTKTWHLTQAIGVPYVRERRA